jgi:hypothetical protein
MPKYRVITTFHEGTDEAKGPGEIIELTEEQAAPFVQTKRLAPYSEPGGFAQEVKKHKLLPDEPKEQPALTPEPSAFAQEVEKHKLLPDELPALSIKQLTALPEWAQVPEPKPTKKADIMAAIRAVREG